MALQSSFCSKINSRKLLPQNHKREYITTFSAPDTTFKTLLRNQEMCRQQSRITLLKRNSLGLPCLRNIDDN